MNYLWNITSEIQNLLIKFEAQKISLDNLQSLPHIEYQIRQKTLLRSAVYSARIEGYPDEEDSPKKASQNLLAAYNQIHSNIFTRVDIENIKKLHLYVMKDLSADAGRFRSEPWAIYDQSGSAIYLAPMHFEVPNMMEEFVSYLPGIKEHPAVISAIAQFIFEKIHPFADGNGRVGRLISAQILYINGFGLRGLIPFEKYIESHRSEYYAALEGNKDITDFIKFFLISLTTGIEEILPEVLGRKESEVDLLLPRRREILNIISDHPLCTFDMLRRRFLSINEKTLHYDLSQLQKKGYVQKVGTTKGALYKKTDHTEN